MMQKIKTILLLLFVTVVVLCIASLTIMLVFYDVNYPARLWRGEEIRIRGKEPIEEKEKEIKVGKEEEKKEEIYCTVETSKGSVKGHELPYKYPKDDKTKYCAFQGIPYAKPPTGNLRFKGPEPIEKWEGELDATKEKDVCPQKSVPGRFPTEVIGSEDCLYLNVYVPKKADETKSSLPVMVWIHGGGFQYGSGNSDYFGPDFLIANDVILVTFNYRLGALGFLNLNVEGAPGNAGIKDQLSVLNWVKSNIAKFGGDPKNITLFGEDAGAVSVELLLLVQEIYKSGNHYLPDCNEDEKKKLFHKIIVQSGALTNPWAFDPDAEKNALDLVDEFKIKKQDYDSIIEELRKIPSKELVLAQDKVVSLEDLEKLRMFPFVPSQEKPLDNTNLITFHPHQSLSSGVIPDIPCIIGINNAEALITFLYYKELVTPQLLESLNNVPDIFIPTLISHFESDVLRTAVKNIIKKFYFKNERITWEKMPEFINLLSDGSISIGMFMATQLWESTPSPLYVYEFAMEGKLNYFGNKAKEVFNEMNENVHKLNKDEKKTDDEANGHNNVKLAGASHFDELGYLFLMNKFDEAITIDSPEYKVRNQMSTMWTNFAKTTNPNGNNVTVNWTKATYEKPTYLKIGAETELMHTNVETEHFIFWKTVFIAVFQKNPVVLFNYIKELTAAGVTF